MSSLLWQPMAWWVGATLLYALTTNAAFVAQQTTGWRAPRGAAEGLRALYLVGVPVLALWQRVPAPGQMGLGIPRPWLGGTVAALVVATLLAGWVVLVERTRGAPWRTSLRGHREGIAGQVLEAVQLESHWAFARAAGLSMGFPSMTGGEGAHLSAALSLALLLLLLEAVVSPRRRAALLESPVPGPRPSYRAALAVLSMVSFALCLSSVVALVGHLVVRLSLYGQGLDLEAVPKHEDHPNADAVTPGRVKPTVV